MSTPPDSLSADAIPVIGYIRVSMEREEMISPATQRASIEMLAARTGRKVIDWVEDLDMTGRNFNRRIMKVIDRVQAGEAQEILVWKFSRFGRTRKGNIVNLARLEDAGGRLVSATEDIDAETATGKFTRGMLLEIAAFESDRAGEIWAEVYGHRVKNGLPPHGRPRFGYKRLGRVRDPDNPKRTHHIKGEDEKYVPDAEQGPVLAAMYRAYLGGEGFTAIARRLTADGWRTSYKNKWQQAAVMHVLDSGFGAGMLWLHDPSCRCKNQTKCRRKRYVRGAHDPVISPDEWEAYRERRAGMLELPPRSRTPAYPVTGLVKCGHCQSAMVVSGTGQDDAPLLKCSRQRRHVDCPGRPSLTLDKVVDAVKDAVGAWALDIDTQARAAAARDREVRQSASAIERLEAALAVADRELVNLARARAADTDGILSDDSWKGAAAEARAERDQVAADLQVARKRRRRPEAALIPVMAGVMEEWDTLPPGAINAMLRSLLRRVAVYKTGERERDALGHWQPMPVRIETHPVWEPDPWNEQTEAEATII